MNIGKAVAIATAITLAPMATAVARTSSTDVPAWSTMLPKELRQPCGTEGENNCYWNAQTMGNGQGHSYIVRTIPHRDLVCIMYVGLHYSRNDYCEPRG